ncbi:hypothetical protein LEN26_011684 [Aphanomyces euteiches]|nr:hypothetical protein AeMF1_013289 [Aphanomyces euteiches]KAH9119390.1 hypothetical protein LEN26_011684 [Aphanomyces euteiches]KAH9189925.1 hypothetical protein AeNC1_008095 [Aphanomyces euteiches]
MLQLLLFQMQIKAERLFHKLPASIKAEIVRMWKLQQEETRPLEKLHQVSQVISILSAWKHALEPYQGLIPKPPSKMETTLVGNPACRQYGHQWLCHKAMRMAIIAHPEDSLGCSKDDEIISWPHLGEDDVGTSLDAIQFHSKYTVKGDYKDVGAALWETYVSSSPQHSLKARLCCFVLDNIHDELVYICVEYGPLKTKVLHVGARFQLENRMVVTLTTIAYDERFPMRDEESRLHGFSWMVLDNMGDGVTLCRQSCLQYTPVNQERSLTLEEIGRLIHYELRENEPREVVIGKFQDMVETSFIMQRDLLIRARFQVD